MDTSAIPSPRQGAIEDFRSESESDEVQRGDNEFIADGEWTSVQVGLSHTIKERLLIGLSVPYISRTGGFADRAIENFHNTFGLKNFSRGDEPRNRVLIQFTGKDGESRRIEGSSSGIGDLVLYGSYLLRKGDKDRSALSTQISLSLPTGDEDQLEGTGEVGILGEFSEGVYEVALGGKWRMGIHSLIELAIVLNVINFRNSADLGAHLNWSTFF